MANNQYVNKVVNGESGDVLIDLTADTITASSLMQGYTAHDKSGAPIVGTATGGGTDAGTVTQDPDGYLVLDDDSGGKYDPSDSTATAADILYPKTAYISGGKVTGSIVTKSSSDLTASGATVTAPAGYYATAASKSVASGSVSASASKGTVSNHSVSVTPSANVTTAGYISSGATGTAVTVSASELVSGTLAIDSSGTKDVTNYASASVAAGGATASASKGTVSNHSVTVTPSVTTTAGYVTAGTSSGTAVTVSASELVSGTKSITANDTGIDVTNYASVDVAVPSVSPTLITKSITENGTYNASSDNADGYSSVTVNVSGGGGGLEYETGTWTTPTDVLKTSILFSDTHSVAPFYFMVSDETEEYYSTKSSVYNICYYNFHQLFGVAYNVDNNGTYHYGYVYRRWRNSSTGITGGVITLLYPYTDSGYIYNTYPRSWVNETGITAQSSSADYFRAGRIYKWIAVWAPTS